MGRAPTNIKQKLIETASDLIWASSYGSVSVDDICKAAGAKKGSFYYYFESKADLAMAALDAHAAMIAEYYREIFEADVSPMQKLSRVADLVYAKQSESLEKYGHVCGCAFASLGTEVAGCEEKIRSKTEEIMRMKRLEMAGLVREVQDAGLMPADYDADEKAEEIQSYVIGRMTMAKLNNSLECLRDLNEGMCSILGIKEDALETA